MTRQLLLPVAALLAVAGAVGLLLGLNAAPPTESEIIRVQAARYVAETGGDAVDCYAVPAGVEDIRLIVICEPQDGEPWFAAVDDLGQPVEGAIAPGEDET